MSPAEPARTKHKSDYAKRPVAPISPNPHTVNNNEEDEVVDSSRGNETRLKVKNSDGSGPSHTAHSSAHAFENAMSDFNKKGKGRSVTFSLPQGNPDN